ncbi:hypothetical protein JYU34_014356 [Plutella xylostella]|uniref:Uncharacterized protein n=1 Tax=Plutella xylostella TaxID=51655 RepID=A0ABQ7Q887_PLUXY|nr:hypothetical protein JYU34_014356 [Plutella xylostella]
MVMRGGARAARRRQGWGRRPASAAGAPHSLGARSQRRETPSPHSSLASRSGRESHAL